MSNFIVLTLIVAILFFAIRHIIQEKKKGTACIGCGSGQCCASSQSLSCKNSSCCNSSPHKPN